MKIFNKSLRTGVPVIIFFENSGIFLGKISITTSCDPKMVNYVVVGKIPY